MHWLAYDNEYVYSPRNGRRHTHIQLIIQDRQRTEIYHTTIIVKILYIGVSVRGWRLLIFEY